MLGLGGHDDASAHPPLGGQRGDELIGEVLADEHQRLELHDRVVEGLLDPPLGWRLGPAGQAVVDPGGEVVGVATGRSEAGQDVTGRQRGEVPEAGQTHAGEQPDELGVGLAEEVQPRHRERGEEGRAGAGSDDHRRPAGPAGGDGGGEAPVGDADAEPGALDGCRLPVDGGDQLLGEALVAAEVARRAAGAEAQPARLDDLEAGGEPADRPHDGLEGPGVAIGVVVEQGDVGAQLLGLAAALADDDALGGRRRRAGDDPVGVEHDRRRRRRHPGRDDRPVRAPHGDHPPLRRHGGRAHGQPTERSRGSSTTGGRVGSGSSTAATPPPGPGSHSSAWRGGGCAGRWRRP